MMSLITCLVNNSPKHVDQLKALVMSICENAPNERVVVNLLDFDDMPTDVSHINRNVAIHYRKVGTQKIPKSKIAAFMWCYRSVVMSEMIINHNEPILYLDVDTLVRAPLDDFWLDVESASIKIMRRDTKEDISKFQAGVFAVGNSKATRDMMKYYNTVVQADIHPFAEQKLLYQAWLMFRDKVEHVQLDSKYNDWHFNSKSIIWHSKGKHFGEKRYQDEYQGYLSRANAKLPRYCK